MNFALLRCCFKERAHWERLAIGIWAIVLVVVCVRAYLAPQSHTVYPIFSSSGSFWLSGTDLYGPDRPADAPTGYRYSPACTLLFVPFSFLPDELGGVAWRLFSAAVLLASLAWFARCIASTPLSTTQYSWVLLLILPMSLQSLANGQANILVAGAILAAVAAMREQRWNLACALLAFTFACKLYPIALGMVLLVLYPRQLAWRLPLALAAAMALPFLFQHPAYVMAQYADWIAILREEDRTSIAPRDMYRDLWLLIHIHGVPVSRSVYTLIQLAGGGMVAWVCLRGQRSGWSEPRLLAFTMTFSLTWMMLLGPATESSSFALLAPALAWLIVDRLLSGQSERWNVPLAASVALFALGVLAGLWSWTVQLHALGVHAWASLCLFVYLLLDSRSSAAEEQSVPCPLKCESETQSSLCGSGANQVVISEELAWKR